MELTTLSLFAADRNRTAHGVYNVFGNGHAKSGSLGFLNTGIVLTDKGFKDLALEFLFTSEEGTVVRYMNMENGSVGFEQSDVKPENTAEILSMQEGMIVFVEKYCEYRNACNRKIVISPYVAFRPLLDALQDRQYLGEIYRNFPHDSTWTPYKEEMWKETFGEYFGTGLDGGANETG